MIHILGADEYIFNYCLLLELLMGQNETLLSNNILPLPTLTGISHCYYDNTPLDKQTTTTIPTTSTTQINLQDATHPDIDKNKIAIDNIKQVSR